MVGCICILDFLCWRILSAMAAHPSGNFPAIIFGASISCNKVVFAIFAGWVVQPSFSIIHLLRHFAQSLSWNTCMKWGSSDNSRLISWIWCFTWCNSVIISQQLPLVSSFSAQLSIFAGNPFIRLAILNSRLLVCFSVSLISASWLQSWLHSHPQAFCSHSISLTPFSVLYFVRPKEVAAKE